MMFLRLSTVPPSVSHITGPSIVYAHVPTELRCTIRRVGQRELKVKWYKLVSGSDSAPGSPTLSETEPVLAAEDLSEQTSLQSESRHHVSVLTVCLTVSEDLTTYQCVVFYRGKRITRETTVKVKGEFVCFQKVSTCSEG